MKFIKAINEWDKYGSGSKPVITNIAGIDLEFQHEAADLYYFSKPGTFEESGEFSEEEKRILSEAFDNSIIVYNYKFPSTGHTSKIAGVIEIDINHDTIIELLQMTTEKLDI